MLKVNGLAFLPIFPLIEAGSFKTTSSSESAHLSSFSGKVNSYVVVCPASLLPSHKQSVYCEAVNTYHFPYI